jgi:hypothetical protein
VRPALRDQISAYMKLMVATEMTEGRFHRIRSSAAAKCASAPKLRDFHTAWASSRHSVVALRVFGDQVTTQEFPYGGREPTSTSVGRRRRRHIAQELIAAVPFDRG